MRKKLNPQFENELCLAGYDKEKLLSLMNIIDSKRSVSSRLSRLSSLVYERELVVRRLAEIKRNSVLINREMHSRPPALTAAFVAATRLLVDRKTLSIIEQAAEDILSKTHF
ncbi:hypothetical protein D6V10_07085 [Vibrio cholerae]|uniref:hypothetical protein n=1 Tax=Vibrio cholerae TaxID=666 RepID=UPI0011823863|nr:hypothetical protein [Vibrio cholerae]MBJ6954130.1 hypothetical protein [Vibrio cholerae]MVC22206.1 hypothetical protein [Vibrio cholerae]TVN18844.1 hypothetical protein FPW20_07335 [Vibrio cholerae]